jgi:hypothetical protein
MAVNYSKLSPYAKTETHAFYLDVAKIPSILYDPSDVSYVIDAIYEHRPDLLAFDIYGDTAFWWVFAARNPNTIQDPIFDFLPGATIYIPKKDSLTAILGV